MPPVPVTTTQYCVDGSSSTVPDAVNVRSPAASVAGFVSVATSMVLFGSPLAIFAARPAGVPPSFTTTSLSRYPVACEPVVNP